jgi:transposase
MKKLPTGDYEGISGDNSYCSRYNCTLTENMGMIPFFKPQRGTTASAKGSSAWHRMIRLWKDNKELFEKEYHRRSVIEAVIGAEKQRLGHTLFSKKDDLQYKELRLKKICYNLLVLNKMKASFLLNEPPLNSVEKVS